MRQRGFTMIGILFLVAGLGVAGIYPGLMDCLELFIKRDYVYIVRWAGGDE